MNIIKRDPWSTLANWPGELADYYNFGGNRSLTIDETDTELIVEAVVAGVSPENIDVNIEDGVLTIKAEVKEESKTEGEEAMLRRRYFYSTALSGGAWDKAEAEIEHGVVKIHIPKAESAKPRKISVKAKGK